MKRMFGRAALSGLLSLVPVGADPSAAERAPAVAGQFYPGEPAQLEAAVRAYLRDARPAGPSAPIALIAPHAGYVFSGQICADAWRQAMGHEYDVIVILGTNHTAPDLEGVALYDGSSFRTPLGAVPVDEALVRDLIARVRVFVARRDAHAREHSIEVQVPFAQVAFPGVPLVAAVVGDVDPEILQRAGQVLAQALGTRRPLIVVSSDLSHYPRYEDAVASDYAVLAAVAGMDPDRVRRTIEAQMDGGFEGLSTCACGEAPILVAMAAARALGATRGIVVSYANSGDSPLGERDRVVGYGAVALVAGGDKPDVSALLPPAVPSADTPLDGADGKTLLTLARETIRRQLATGTIPLPRGGSAALTRFAGAFVTLRRHGELRGCIGHTEPDRPLIQVVASMALEAAFKDPRFDPLAANELPETTIEVSVLGPLRRVSGPEAIVLGRDGVMLHKGGRSALFLPSVAAEQGWDRDQMLDHLCAKAGLPADCWHGDAALETFQTTVFGEDAGR